MSHRALVAIRRRDGRFDCYDVPVERTAGSDARWPDDHVTGPTAGEDRFTDALRSDPDVEPTASGVAFGTAIDRFLDPLLHEALVVVGPDGEARTYVVLPYLLATAEGLHTDAPAGAAVSLSGIDGSSLSASYVRGWHHGVTEALGEAVDRGLLSSAEAVGWLEDAVRRLAGDRHDVLDVPTSG